MYLEKKKTKGGTKYYLAHSFREGKKIHKIRKLLGTNLPGEIVEDRKKKAEKLILEEIEKYQIIKDPLEKELTREELQFIEDLQRKNYFKVHHLSDKEWKLFSKIFTYNTNAIEGSKISDKEVNKIIDKDEWPKEKSKEDIAETYGVDEAINVIRKTSEHISLNLLREIHRVVFKNSKSFAGEFRQKGQEVAVMSSSGEIVHEGAPQSRIISLLINLVRWYETHKKKYPALVLAAVVHNQFENIHPFADGNGRVGRIILNNILVKNDLPPINIELKDRFEYYKTLEEYEKKKNIRPTIEFLLKEYKNTKEQLKNKL